MDIIFLYGPPGSGKTTVGSLLAKQLDLPYVDLDVEIESQAGNTIPEIFAKEGETGFRKRELEAIAAQVKCGSRVVALGGGALLQPEARRLVEEHGQVLCLTAELPALLHRLADDGLARPLLAGDAETRLKNLLAAREAHYNGFPLQIDTTHLSPEEAAWQAQVKTGRFRVSGMGQAYDVLVEPGALGRLGELLQARKLKGPVAVVSDSNVGPLYGQRVEDSLRRAGYPVRLVMIPAGEAHKNLDTMQQIWAGFVQARLERGSTVLALGGGVAGDMAGFAAATFLRGMNWVNVPTTLLSMVDSSLGGKTGIDLPQGKNLVGAFHPPRLVLADPEVLRTLPAAEIRSGLAETIKHGIIADPGLLDLCVLDQAEIINDATALVRRGMAVKVNVIEQDPYEKGVRQALNLGHTVGHGVELASDFHLSHGECVAIGTVIEARIAEYLNLANPNLSIHIAENLKQVGLPTEIPTNLLRERIIEAMQMDKKRAAGKLRFALPERIGSVRVGVEVENWQELIFQTPVKTE